MRQKWIWILAVSLADGPGRGGLWQLRMVGQAVRLPG